MSDLEIIQRVLTGEKEAFSILVKKYQNAIHGLAFHTTQNTHDAEDIAQEAFMEAFHRLPTLREADKFASWLRAIANNLCANWIRKKKFQTNLEERLSNRPETSEVSTDFGSFGIGTDDDTYESLMKVVNTLSEPNRIVIILKYLEGLSNSEIAEFLGISSSAVNVRIHRSMKQLQGKITKALEEGFKNKRLDESFAERVHKRIAERKQVTVLTVNFGNVTDDERNRIQQLIINSNATILDNLPEIPPNPPLPKGGTIIPKVKETEVSTSKARGTEVSTSEVKGDRGDFSEKALIAFYGMPTTRESDPIRKPVIQYAAVLGESFRSSILARLFPQVDMEKTLTMLTNADFIQRAAEPDLIHFKHALIQEAILNSIAPASRRQIHYEIAQTLEEFHREQIEPFSTMLAHHYKFAGDEEKTLKYALKAAQYHARKLEYRQAARCYRIALTYESALNDKERYDTYMKFGDDSLLGLVFSHLAGIILEYDSRQAIIFAQEALRYYEQMDDELATVAIHGCIGRAHYLLGNTEKAIAACEQMLKFDGLFDVWWLGVGCLGSLVQNYVQRGDWELARKMFFRMLNLERLLKAVFDVEHAASLFDVERTASSLETGELSEFPWREPNDNLIDGYLDCVKVMNSIDKVYGYALTVIDLTPGPSPDCFAMLATSACGEASGRKVQIRIGYDDYVTVWLNGKKLLETTGGSPCIYDDVIVDATLQPGQNRLLVKIGNIEPGWGFLVRITNANGVTFDNLSYASPIAKA